LECQQRKYKHMILLDPATNVALFHTAPDYEEYEIFSSTLKNPNNEPVAFAIHPISDDEVTDDEASEGDDADEASSTAGNLGHHRPTRLPRWCHSSHHH
jgi:hypothetical protein